MSDRQKTEKNDGVVSTIVDHHGSTPASLVARRSIFVIGFSVRTLAFVPACGQQTRPTADSHALYRQTGAPIEQRVGDLLGRMTREACRIARTLTVDQAIEALAKKVPCVVVKRGPKGSIVRVGD